jgi:hypothetical protein
VLGSGLDTEISKGQTNYDIIVQIPKERREGISGPRVGTRKDAEGTEKKPCLCWFRIAQHR